MSIEQEECTRALPKALARRGHAFRSDDVVDVKISGHLDPIVIAPTEQGDASILAIVMPMRI